MQHVSSSISTAATRLRYARRSALLLALGAAGPAAWGQSFGSVTLYGTGLGSQPRSIALGDVNRDGRLDIVTAYAGTGAAGVLLGQANGFAAAQAYSLGTNTRPLRAVLSDTNRDGLLDIVAANNDYNPGHIGVLLGQTIGFGTVSTYTTSPVIGPCAVAAGDLNADGFPDVVTVNNFTNDASILAGQAGGFMASTTVSTGTGSTPIEVTLGDVNGDGRPDIVTANANRTVGVLLAQAGGGFGATSLYATGALSSPRGLALGDVNGDGRMDIVAANDGSGYVGVLLGQAGGFAPVVRYGTGGSFSNYVALGDVNGDGRLDIVTTDYMGNSVGLLLGQAGGFGQPLTYPTGTVSTPSQPLGLALGDVNGDNRLDIVVANSNSNTVGVLLNTGTFTPLAARQPAAADLALYPNPAHEAFTVQLPADLVPTQAELLNSLGQAVQRPAVGSGSRFVVETNGLAPGLYTLRLQAGGATLTRRVVVE